MTDGSRSIDALIVEDSASVAALIQRYLAAEGYRADRVSTGVEAMARLENDPPPVVLLDLGLPDIAGTEIIDFVQKRGQRSEIIVVTGEGSLQRAIEVMRAGARDFLVKPVSKDHLCVAVRNALESRDLRAQLARLKTQMTHDRFHGFVGASPAMRNVYDLICNVATSKATVFITGESGTGKEVAAEALHKESSRRERPFVAINCGAIPKDLLESELFGHVKGAFTGATADREGAAGRAHTGTLFLDEICEMPLEMQVKLLRFTQTSTYQKLGSSQTKQADVRLICATNRDPLEEVRGGRFREDLYYRLYVVPLELPALRDRREDIIGIAQAFLDTFSIEENRSFRGFAPETRQLLERYDWPGNVRQLQNVIRNVVVLHDGDMVRPEMLPAPLLGSSFATSAQAAHAVGDGRAPAAADDGTIKPLWLIEKLAIERALTICNGNIQEASKQLEISPSTIYRKKNTWLEQGLEVDPRLLGG
jgi:DNA-binding NtrC family response regulator